MIAVAAVLAAVLGIAPRPRPTTVAHHLVAAYLSDTSWRQQELAILDARRVVAAARRELVTV